MAYVARHLPARTLAIEAAFSRSESFRSLCDDFRLCADAMAAWQASDAPMARDRQREYAQWLEELESEIVEWLEHPESFTDSGPQGSGETT